MPRAVARGRRPDWAQVCPCLGPRLLLLWLLVLLLLLSLPPWLVVLLLLLLADVGPI